MKRFYFTFGQKYRHEPHPQGGHPDGWFTVEAATEEEARTIMAAHCGRLWATSYDKQPDIEIYPLGELARLFT